MKKISQDQCNFFELQCQKMKYSANFIDYLGFLIGLKFETIRTIA